MVEEICSPRGKWEQRERLRGVIGDRALAYLQSHAPSERLPPTRPQLPVAIIIHSPPNCTTSWGPRPLGAPSYPSHFQTELHIHNIVSLRHILLKFTCLCFLILFPLAAPHMPTHSRQFLTEILFLVILGCGQLKLT